MSLYLILGSSVYLCQNNLKNRKFDKEAAQNFNPEQATIPIWQGASDPRNSGERRTQSKTNSSSCFGIWGKVWKFFFIGSLGFLCCPFQAAHGASDWMSKQIDADFAYFEG